MRRYSGWDNSGCGWQTGHGWVRGITRRSQILGEVFSSISDWGPKSWHLPWPCPGSFSAEFRDTCSPNKTNADGVCIASLCSGESEGSSESWLASVTDSGPWVGRVESSFNNKGVGSTWAGGQEKGNTKNTQQARTVVDREVMGLEL